MKDVNKVKTAPDTAPVRGLDDVRAAKNAGTGLGRIWNAFFYSRDGLVGAYRREAAFRQECWLALLLIPLALWLPVGYFGKALMIGSVLLVLIVELLNSAVEAVVDLASPQQHALAKHAKDVGSAAVLISLINVGSVWLLVWLAR